ncbi:hypothetical protein [Absidia glauca]|uniref:1-phosphatidylinositol-4-phosphate 5-kinase n=1 Tax=Absidia glauca TaxID=4829 RepID=A0A163JGY0_ABSGL|nr:hypothetical protein [Absidia glauca]
MSVASLSHQSLQDHVSKPSPFVPGDHDQQYTVAPTAVTNLFTHQQQQQQQQQQQDDALLHPHQKKDSQDLAQLPHLPTDLEQQHASSTLDIVSEPSELSPPSTPTPLPKTTKNMDSLRDPLIHSNQAQTPTTTTTTTTTLDHAPSVQPYPFDVQTLHERTLQQFQMDDNDEIKFKRHSTHGAIIHAKRRDTTMGILPLHPTEYDPSSSSSTAYPLTTSTTTAGATSSSFIHDGTQSTKTATVTRHGSTSTLTRHNTTGHTLQQRLNKHKKPVTELSEEFQKELTARRKAFRRLSRRKKDMDIDDDRVMIGTRIGEGHQNYVLMYNMLTGIRIAVGRVSAKIDRALTTEDFSGAHKLAFDVTGDELTPGAKYDFKFKDYAPWVFRHLREQFGIDPADYLISLTSKYILSELGSPGKSGSFFYYSRDYRFIIKTIHHTEHKFMRKILKQYHDHVINNPNTLLCRYYGLHRVKLPRGRKIHFVVMGNVFPPNKDVHETYDLKVRMPRKKSAQPH